MSSLTTQLTATLAFNTAGATNTPQPTDYFMSAIGAGGTQQSPVLATVAASGTYSFPALSGTLYHFMIGNTGSNTVTFNMKNTAGNTTSVDIAPGGRMYWFNVSAVIGATGYFDLITSTVTSVSGSTITWAAVLT